jgi:hypothetical protein
VHRLDADGCTPLPLSEYSGLLEDVARRSPASLFIPDTVVLPAALYHTMLGAILEQRSAAR